MAELAGNPIVLEQAPEFDLWLSGGVNYKTGYGLNSLPLQGFFLSQPVKVNLQSVPPVNLLIVGLQGSGKTTASAKLALKLKNQGKKVLLVSLDTYRPAAQDQLEILAKSIAVDALPIIKDQLPVAITERAMSAAKLSGYDVVIYDTAGRLHIDDDMINEAIKIKSFYLLGPINKLD